MTLRDPLEQVGDEELMERYLAGSHAAFALLLQRYERRLFHFISSLVGRDRYLAEELFQETFLRIVKVERLGSYFRTAKFSTYLFTIARNLCYDHLRRGRPNLSEEQVFGEAGFDRCPDGAASPEETVIAEEQQAKVEQLLCCLSPEQREVVMLRTKMDMPFKEIAAVTESNENTVKSRYRYALEYLTGQLSTINAVPPMTAVEA